MRLSAVIAAVCVSAAGLSFTDNVQAGVKKLTHIPSEDLGAALQTLAQERGFQVVYVADEVNSLKSAGASGNLTTEEALKAVLGGTGLTYKYFGENAVSIVSAASSAGKSSNSSHPEKESGGGFRLSDNGENTSSVVGEEGRRTDTNATNTIAEVIVTAQKREERLQDVPVPVTAISGEVLTQSNLLRLQDYYSKVPGLNMQIGGSANTPILSIRGIQNGQGGGPPSVGVVIDDVPYGSAVDLGARGQPDIDPGDLARIEVLRGPQGTLYGASSIGGLLKFVTIDPSTQSISGRIQAGISTLSNGVDPGYNFRGSVNLPVNDALAARVSAFREVDGGFIKNIETGREGFNRRTSDGGRLAMLWKPSEVLSLKLSALLQDSKRDGADIAVVAPGFGDLQEKSIPNTGGYDEKTQAYSATLKAKFGDVELTSLTGFNVDHLNTTTDLTRVATGFWDFLANTYSNTVGPGSIARITSNTNRFSEEVRLAIPITEQLNWLLGGFYTDEHSHAVTTNSGANPATGMPVGPYFESFNNNVTYKEYAAFTNFTYDVTSQFNVQFGARLSENKQTFSSVRTGTAAVYLECPAGVDTCAGLDRSSPPSKGSAFTYLVTPQYKISPDLMVYTRFASGYRPGGPNIGCTENIPCAYSAEKTKNYDLGLKADFFDHALTLDTSLYYIDYSDIQVGLTATPGGVFVGYKVNEGKAKSQGLEISVDAKPLRGLDLSAWVTWNTAEFTQTLVNPTDPTGQSFLTVDGRRLPYSSRFSGNFSVDQEFSLTEAVSAFAGGAVSYIGNRTNGPQILFPAYAQTDLRAGLKYDAWTVTAFANNVTDKRGILAGGLDYQYLFPDQVSYSYIQPRTVGVNFSRTF